jgi:surface antigen
MTDVLIVNQHAVDIAVSTLSSASGSTADTNSQLNKHRSSVFASGAYQFIQQFMHDVVDDVVDNVPSTLAKVISSYARGLTDLADVIAAADQQLSVEAAHSKDGALQAAGAAGLLLGGTVVTTLTEITPQGIPLHPQSGPSVQLVKSTAPEAAAPRDALDVYGTPTGARTAFDSASAASNNWGDDALQCTSWANFRRQQLGLSTNIRGNGGQMVGGKAASALPSVDPSRVSIGSLVSEGGDPGHVMVIEKVLAPTPGHAHVFQVSEMNYKGDDAGEISLTSQLQQNADGTWTLMRPSSTTDASSSLVLGWQERSGLQFSTGIAG